MALNRRPPAPPPPPPDDNHRRQAAALAALVRVTQMEHGRIAVSVRDGVVWLKTEHSHDPLKSNPGKKPRDEHASEHPHVQTAGRVLAEIWDRPRAVFHVQVFDGVGRHMKIAWGEDTSPQE